MSATVGSRYRGRQTRGGRIALVSVAGRLELEEWELQQLLRFLPTDLHRALRPSRTPREEQTAREIADAVGSGHPAHAFFASSTGGFTVERV